MHTLAMVQLPFCQGYLNALATALVQSFLLGLLALGVVTFVISIALFHIHVCF